MDTPQIIILLISCIVFIAAFVFYFKANSLAGTTTIMVALILSLVGGMGPSNIKDIAFKQSESGFEVSMSRNTDSPEKIQSVIEATIEVNEGVTSSKNDILVQESKDVPDAKRSAADYLVLATNSWESGNFIDGIAFAQQGLRLDPKDIRLRAALLHRMGDLLSSMGDKVRAEEFYRISISVDPKFSWPLNSLGIVLSESKRYDEAEDAYRKAIEIDSKHASTHYNLGNMLSKLKRYDEAEDAYRKAIEINPKHASALYTNLGNVLRELKRYDEAEDAYRKAIEIYPMDVSAHYNLGIILSEVKRYDEAEDAYRKAIEIDPKHAGVHHNMGNMLMELKRYDEAEDAYRKAIEIYPSDVSAHYNLGNMLRYLKTLRRSQRRIP